MGQLKSSVGPWGTGPAVYLQPAAPDVALEPALKPAGLVVGEAAGLWVSAAAMSALEPVALGHALKPALESADPDVPVAALKPVELAAALEVAALEPALKLA